LRDAGLVKGNYDGIKLLGEGEIKTSLTLKVDKASRSAVTKVEAAGGKVETV
jgi:large subunit ribosomal protein L15